MSHAAIPAPASTPNAKTAMRVITRAGVRDVVLCGARSCSAIGTRQRSPTPAQGEARFVPAAIGGRLARSLACPALHGLCQGCQHSILALAAARAKALPGPVAGQWAGPELRPPPRPPVPRPTPALRD
jgi:hypothetical protein